MTNKQAKAIIEKEYKCVDRDCDIERSCGKCDLMIPTKEPILEAYKVAMEVIDLIGYIKDRPCSVCKFHSKNGCSKWDCVFDDYLE